MGTRGQNSEGRPGLPTWARSAADWLFGPGGYLGEAQQGQGMYPLNYLFGGLGSSLDAINQAGPMQRQLAASLTEPAIQGSQQLAQSSLAGGESVGWLNSLMPNMFGAAQQYAGGGVNPAMAAGRQSLQNVMDPTFYNPLFQNAAQQITPQINSAFGARGLGSSGPATQALSEAYQGLGNQFAQRQFQEQMQAQNQLGGLGLNAAQLPGNIYGQFMQGAGMGQQALGQGIQNQLGPLGALGAGWQQYLQGVSAPIDIATMVYQLSRSPMETLMGTIPGVMGGISTPKNPSWLGHILGK